MRARRVVAARARDAKMAGATVLRALKRRGLRWGVAAMCIGGGQGIGCLIENKQ